MTYFQTFKMQGQQYSPQSACVRASSAAIVDLCIILVKSNFNMRSSQAVTMSEVNFINYFPFLPLLIIALNCKIFWGRGVACYHHQHCGTVFLWLWEQLSACLNEIVSSIKGFAACHNIYSFFYLFTALLHPLTLNSLKWSNLEENSKIYGHSGAIKLSSQTIQKKIHLS